MASQSGTGSGALASTSTDSEGQAHDKNTRSVWKSTLLTWPSELLECYRFEYNKEGTKAIKATCIVCSNHWGKILFEYRGKLTNKLKWPSNSLNNFGVFWCSFTLFSIKMKSYENIYYLKLLFLHVISVFLRWNSSNLL